MLEVMNELKSFADGVMEVGNQRVKVNEMSDVLASRYAFLSGESKQ